MSLEILNLAAVAAVAVIWRPTAHSRLLVSMQQLNTDEFGEFDDDEDGLELADVGDEGEFSGSKVLV